MRYKLYINIKLNCKINQIHHMLYSCFTEKFNFLLNTHYQKHRYYLFINLVAQQLNFSMSYILFQSSSCIITAYYVRDIMDEKYFWALNSILIQQRRVTLHVTQDVTIQRPFIRELLMVHARFALHVRYMPSMQITLKYCISRLSSRA